MPATGLLGEDQLAIHRDLEQASGGLNQPDVGLRVLLLQLSRQTGSSRLIVSNNAVLDCYMHVAGRLTQSGTEPPES
jgi:hypothetical protein